jgi:hypothetical protein
VADVSGLCLTAGGAVIKWLGITSFTLAWMHSVQKTSWEEDWQVSPAGLKLVAARVQGHGAGMEPPEGARFEQGIWHWVPDVKPLTEISLRRSDAVDDWQICAKGQCQPLTQIVPPPSDPVVLSPCL